MVKSVFSNAKTFAKNVGKHVGRVILRRETTGDAIEEVRRDAQKMRTSVRDVAGKGDRKSAAHLTEEGRCSYNVKDYVSAEEFFRQAIRVDEKYALAYTYLGHTLYKKGKFRDAATMWRRAIVLEPDSDAAAKARRKLQHLEHAEERFKHQVEDRLGK
ncbi:MAG: tetratricopeptide repeat protein [Candidatus Hydrogenedentes bacterium]|nr:tetratricopeptide repeat protein [Candidatus Hydrogenedentota bacterium]